ncbi:MAG TPA: nucleotide pyrophosphohydrolase [Candidatus Fimivicinus intestinavium]|nr:nucleotide pyrophosphohydrolase [Candidatus Fimivicinus intestinavium]
MKEAQQQVEQFLHAHHLALSPQGCFTDLVSEIGEAGKELLLATQYETQPFARRAELEEELGDCLFSILRLCSSLQIDAQGALALALKKYEARFMQKHHIGSEEGKKERESEAAEK